MAKKYYVSNGHTPITEEKPHVEFKGNLWKVIMQNGYALYVRPFKPEPNSFVKVTDYSGKKMLINTAHIYRIEEKKLWVVRENITNWDKYRNVKVEYSYHIAFYALNDGDSIVTEKSVDTFLTDSDKICIDIAFERKYLQ